MYEQWVVGDKEYWIQKLFAAVLICMWDLVSWIQLLQRTLFGCVCDLIFSKRILSARCCWVKFNLLIMNPCWKKSCCIMPLLCALVCIYYLSFWYLFQRWRGMCCHNQQPCSYGITHPAPPLIISKPAHRSILITIQIVIDLTYLAPVAKRSQTILALLETQTQLVLQAKVLAAWMFRWRHVSCVVPMMDGANSGYTFTPAHPTCSSVGGDWLSYCLRWKLRRPTLFWCFFF